MQLIKPLAFSPSVLPESQVPRFFLTVLRVTVFVLMNESSFFGGRKKIQYILHLPNRVTISIELYCSCNWYTRS